MIGTNFKPKNVNDVFTLLEVIANADDAKKYLVDILVATQESEKAAAQTLAIPVYPELGAEQAKYVVDCIAEFME